MTIDEKIRYEKQQFLIIYFFLIYLKLTTQAVQIYTNKIAILLKIVCMLINVN